jgi:hypothetical protein
LPNKLLRKKPAGTAVPYTGADIQLAPYLQQTPALGKPLSLKERNVRGRHGAEHSSGPEVKSLCVEEGFRQFLDTVQPHWIVLQVIGGLRPQANPVSMVSDA